MTDFDDRALEPVKVMARDLKSNRMVEIGVTVRRGSEAKLWAWLEREADYIRAVDRIMWACESFGLLPGLPKARAACWQLGRVDGGEGPQAALEMLMDARRDYYLWSAECSRRGIAHSAVMDVLAQGRSLRAVDRERRCRKGWAREQMDAALALYCQLQGWRRAA